MQSNRIIQVEEKGPPRLLGRSDESVEDHGPGFARRQFAYQRFEGPHAVEHHRELSLAGQPQLGAQRFGLHLARGAVHEVEPRLAHGLRVGEPLAERCNELHVCIPRMYALRAEFDSRPRRAVGVYVDVGKHGDGKFRNLTGALPIRGQFFNVPAVPESRRGASGGFRNHFEMQSIESLLFWARKRDP